LAWFGIRYENGSQFGSVGGDGVWFCETSGGRIVGGVVLVWNLEIAGSRNIY